MVYQRKRRRPEDADARDGNWCNRNGLAMKRVMPAERRFPRLAVRERGNIDTIQGVTICEHRSDTDKRKSP